MHDRRESWLIAIAALAIVFAGIWLAGTSPAEAQTSGSDHSDFTKLTGPFETPQEVTAACLECHVYAADEVMDTLHWTWEYTDPITGQQLGKNNVINNTYVAVPSNEPRCASCHVGFGYTDATFFDTATEVDVDCLVCHDQTGTYRKSPAGSGMPVLGEAREFPAGSGNLWEPVDLATVAQNVGAPGRANCGSCHFFGGGGDAVKHGDLDSTLTNPDRELDVHMGTDSLDFTCTTCHGGEDHEIAGRIYDGEARVLCEDCHTGDEAPHQDSELRTALTQHTENVACQTCHIPAFARGQATMMSWDWSTAGAKNEEGTPYIQKDAEGHVVYDSKKGTFTNGTNVIPDYRWWNGNVTHLTVEDTIDPGQVVRITDTQGSRGDGRITPFKQFTGVQPYDAGHNTMVVPNLFPNDVDDTAAYWMGWDWEAAVASGMATVGADYSGELGWVQTEMLRAQNHMVAPSDEALGCTDCHSNKGRLDFEALGYDPQRAAFLSSLAEPGEPTGAPHVNLTQYAGPETCLTCHRDAGREVAESMHYSWLGVAQNVAGIAGALIGMGTEYGALPASVTGINWLGLLQPQDSSMPPVAGGCAQCHVGFGDRPNPPDALTEADYRNVDCLICHGPDYTRTVVQDNGEVRLAPAAGIDILEVVRNVQRPSSEQCLSCHLNTGGGPNFKHGVSPTSPDVDVHLSAGLQCVDCHQVEEHRFGGSADLKGVDRPDLAMGCADCHDGQHPIGFTAIDMHLDRVACRTCHIPAIARDADYPTLVDQDWTDSILKDSGLHAPAVTLANNVTPTYRWWNGQVQSYPPGPAGSIDDAMAKLTPWKYIESIVPVDAASGDFVPIKAGVFAVTGDLDAAVAKGVEDSGVAYSGDWRPATDELLFSLNHQVAPASEALRCIDCHARDQGRLDFVALGYSEEQAADLVSASGAQGSTAAIHSTTVAEYSPEARAYVGDLDDRLQERNADLGLWLGIIGGIVVGLVLAVVLAALLLRSRDVTRQDARGWLREHRRGAIATLVLLGGTALIGFVSLHYLFEFTASTEFCGGLCHATRAEYVTYHTSLHANVACTECHVGPGLDQELKAKLNGFRELYLMTTNTYERPIASPVETLRPARNVCEQCHWPEVLYADRAVEIPHFANDEDNSRSNTYMLVKIGGGTERAGQGQGIHWHIENKVEYIATDPQRQNIPWVRAKLNGETVTFVDVVDPLSQEELAQYEVREMDCIDCHNRASHVFRSSGEMLDEAMANGILPTDLPYLRREAQKALENHENREVAMTAIEAIPDFYQEAYPDVYEGKQGVLADVVQELKDMYDISHFPEEQVFPTTYPDNLAHSEDPGCFRCHDGKHYAADDGDQSIRLHCTICHTIPQTVDAGEPVPAVPFQPAWQPDNHLSSTWIADHRFTFDNTCVSCHEEETFCANENCHGRSWPEVNLSVATPPFPLP